MNSGSDGHIMYGKNLVALHVSEISKAIFGADLFFVVYLTQVYQNYKKYCLPNLGST